MTGSAFISPVTFPSAAIYFGNFHTCLSLFKMGFFVAAHGCGGRGEGGGEGGGGVKRPPSLKSVTHILQ